MTAPDATTIQIPGDLEPRTVEGLDEFMQAVTRMADAASAEIKLLRMNLREEKAKAARYLIDRQALSLYAKNADAKIEKMHALLVKVAKAGDYECASCHTTTFDLALFFASNPNASEFEIRAWADEAEDREACPSPNCFGGYEALS